MRTSSRRIDDADVIRARLRALLAESDRTGGWVPDGDGDLPPDPPPPTLADAAGEEPEDDTVPPPAVGRHRAPATAVRLDPGRRGARSLWIAGLLAALLLAGWTWLDRPRVEPVAPAEPSGAAPTDAPSVGAAAETASTVVVSVVGLVARPGLVTVPSGSRVADAVAAAGGLLPEADPASVNLAAVVTDGQQIAVGVPGAPGAAPAGSPAGTAGPLDLNAATEADLDALPGIGPVLAQRIVAHRERQGRFTTVEQLDDVPGIGPAIYAQLVDLVTV
ncbi:ComEA family DNA-binding protein [Geodermatophilus sp. SYSU D00815]